jgi:hypothetical protein
MLILQNSKELLAKLKAQNLSQIKWNRNIQLLDIFTTIPYDKIKSRLHGIIIQLFHA